MLRTHMVKHVSEWPPSHECSANGSLALGWTDDALKRIPRLLWVAHRNGVACAAGSSKRAQSTAKLLLTALSEATEAAALTGRGPLPDFAASVRIGVGDVHCSEVALAFATFESRVNRTSPRSCTARLLPSWIFADNLEPGVVPNFSTVSTTLAAIAASHSRAKANVSANGLASDRRCGWAGNALSDAFYDSRNPPELNKPIRRQFVQIARTRPDLFEIIDTDAANTVAGTVNKDARNGYYSIAEQVARWACLIDVRGAGFSVRVPLLLFSGRPLLYVQRPGLQTFHEAPDFVSQWQPWIHYVPVADDLHDLSHRAHWVLSHRDDARRIAEKALAYARCFLTARFARRYAAVELLAASTCASECAVFRERCAACMHSNKWRHTHERYVWLIKPEPGCAAELTTY